MESGHKYCVRTVISYNFKSMDAALDAKNVKWLTPMGLPLPAWEKEVYEGFGLSESVFEPLVGREWADMPEVEKVELPQVAEGNKAFLLRGVFSPGQAKALREAIPPKDSKGYMSSEEVAKRYRTRIVERWGSLDEALSKFVSERIISHLPQMLDGGELRSICPAWRFLHYEGGGHHGRSEWFP